MDNNILESLRQKGFMACDLLKQAIELKEQWMKTGDLAKLKHAGNLEKIAAREFKIIFEHLSK